MEHPSPYEGIAEQTVLNRITENENKKGNKNCPSDSSLIFMCI